MGELFLNDLKTLGDESGGVFTPRYLSEFKRVPDEGRESVRLGVKLWLQRHIRKVDTTGLEGDATLLTTAITTQRALITGDRPLFDAAREMCIVGLDLRLYQYSSRRSP